MRIYLFIIAAFALSSCVKDKPEPTPQATTVQGNRGVFVINEGNFGSANASISLFNPVTGEVAADHYRNTNQQPLGDVAQSMIRYEKNYYVVVNNSGKLIRCNDTLLKTGEASLPSPRYILPVSPAKAYVSDYTANGVHVVDLGNLSVVKKIPCRGWTEQMVAMHGKVFVAGFNSGMLYVINSSDDQVTDSIGVGLGASSVVSDRDDNIWVLSSGDFNGTEPGRLCRIDARSNTKVLSLEFPAGKSPRALTMNNRRDTLYFLAGDIFRMPVQSTTLPQTPFVPSGGKSFYALGVDESGTVYVGDALDYTQRSDVYLYNRDGAQQQVFKAGINAAGFCFY